MMSDARWGDPREYGRRDLGDKWPRVYDERDRDDRNPREGLMHDLDLPRGEDRELVVDRVRVYELNSFECSTVTRECRIRPLLCGRTYATVPLFWTS
jgi:hypothetical protein